MSESMIPSFPHSNIWPYDVTIKGGQTIRVNAASERDARKAALLRYRKGTRVEAVTCAVVTSEQVNRILAA
jgi:23S rRNA maturation mini-RNase III